MTNILWTFKLLEQPPPHETAEGKSKADETIRTLVTPCVVWPHSWASRCWLRIKWHISVIENRRHIFQLARIISRIEVQFVMSSYRVTNIPASAWLAQIAASFLRYHEEWRHSFLHAKYQKISMVSIETGSLFIKLNCDLLEEMEWQLREIKWQKRVISVNSESYDRNSSEMSKGTKPWRGRILNFENYTCLQKNFTARYPVNLNEAAHW